LRSEKVKKEEVVETADVLEDLIVEDVQLFEEP